MEPVEPKRRRYRISLRLVMLLVLVTAVWMGDRVTKARRQREAVAAIKKYGGSVLYEHEFPGPRGKSGPPEVWAPDWMRRLLGDDYLLSVPAVQFMGYSRPGPQQDDEGLALLKNLTGLRDVVLKNTQVTEKGIGYLSELTELESLWIKDAGLLSDAGARRLRGLKNLKSLEINGSQVTDRGWESLSGLDKLELLILTNNQLSDSGLAHLKGLKNLRALAISGTGVTDQGLEHLKGLTKLGGIGVSGTSITEDGIKRFKAAMPNLKAIR